MEARSGLAPVNRVAPVIASGTATAFKLLVATLAFAGAYYGATATHRTATGERPAGQAGVATRTVVLSARSMPHEAERAPRPGVVTVGLAGPGTSCEQTYHAAGVLDPGPSGEPVMYTWRLLRWSPTAHRWQTQQYTGTAGFIGRERTVDWRPRVDGTPGWYRVELIVSGKSPIVSDRFQISC